MGGKRVGGLGREDGTTKLGGVVCVWRPGGGRLRCGGRRSCHGVRGVCGVCGVHSCLSPSRLVAPLFIAAAGRLRSPSRVTLHAKVCGQSKRSTAWKAPLRRRLTPLAKVARNRSTAWSTRDGTPPPTQPALVETSGGVGRGAPPMIHLKRGWHFCQPRTDARRSLAGRPAKR